MPRFNVYAQRIQTQDFNVEALGYDEAKQLAIEHLKGLPTDPSDTEWSYDIDEVI